MADHDFDIKQGAGEDHRGARILSPNGDNPLNVIKHPIIQFLMALMAPAAVAIFMFVYAEIKSMNETLAGISIHQAVQVQLNAQTKTQIDSLSVRVDQAQTALNTIQSSRYKESDADRDFRIRDQAVDELRGRVRALEGGK